MDDDDFYEHIEVPKNKKKEVFCDVINKKGKIHPMELDLVFIDM